MSDRMVKCQNIYIYIMWGALEVKQKSSSIMTAAHGIRTTAPSNSSLGKVLADANDFLQKFVDERSHHEAKQEFQLLTTELFETDVKDTKVLELETMSITAINGLSTASKQEKAQKKILEIMSTLGKNDFGIKEDDLHPAVLTLLKKHFGSEPVATAGSER